MRTGSLGKGRTQAGKVVTILDRQVYLIGERRLQKFAPLAPSFASARRLCFCAYLYSLRTACMYAQVSVCIEWPGALKASQPRQKKFKGKKKLANRSGGRKEAQRERGVLSRRRANKKVAGEEEAGETRKCQRQRPKTRPELSAKPFNLRRERRHSHGDGMPRPA